MKEHDAIRPLTEEDRIKGFIKATGGFARSAERWKERAANGMTDTELAEALAQELGIFGGSCGPGELWLSFQGAGLKIWISWKVENHVQTRPAFQGKSTIAMARLVYGIKDPADIQMAFFLGALLRREAGQPGSRPCGPEPHYLSFGHPVTIPRASKGRSYAPLAVKGSLTLARPRP